MYCGAWMWNPNKIQEVIMEQEEEEEEDDDDESWEVKAFEQDTKGNLSGTTWPPRSYTCNFCRREFRSAQALGGHMNVHRRDRVSKAHNQGPTASTAARNTTRFLNSSCVPPPSTFTIQSNEGLSHFYQFQNPNGIFGNSGDMMMNLYGTTSFPTGNIAFSMLDSNSNCPVENDGDESMKEMKETLVDELDLELRLGHKPP